MAFSIQELTSGGGSSASSVDTASISPGANKLILVNVASKINLSNINTPSISGCNMTWVLIASSERTSAQRNKTALFRGMSSSPSAGALTISWGGQNQESYAYGVVEIGGTIITGSNGADAIVQSNTKEQSGTTTGVSVTLSAFDSPGNMAFGAFGRLSVSSVTPGDGFTGISESAGSDNRQEMEYKTSEDTTVDWTWASADVQCNVVAVEIAKAPEIGGFIYISS